MMIKAISNVIKKGNLKEEDIDYLFGGDLLNQLTSTSFMAREFNIPFFWTLWGMFYNGGVIKSCWAYIRWRIC